MEFSMETKVSEAAFPLYRRRSLAQGGRYTVIETKGGEVILLLNTVELIINNVILGDSGQQIYCPLQPVPSPEDGLPCKCGHSVLCFLCQICLQVHH